jgi:hypothetical protein
MRLKLSLLASNKTTTISVSGEKIIVDDVEFDLSPIPDGGQVEAVEPAIGVIKRVDGVIEMTVLYHYDSNLAELNQPIEIADNIVDIVSGDVASPVLWLPIGEEEVSV